MLAVLLCAAVAPCFAQAGTTTLRVRLEGPELDTKVLLNKLNDNAKDHHLAFVASTGAWDYRIIFRTYQEPGPDGPRSGARATVFGKNGKELFNFSRDNRHTDGGATNAVSKEISKRLREIM